MGIKNVKMVVVTCDGCNSIFSQTPSNNSYLPILNCYNIITSKGWARILDQILCPDCRKSV